MRGHPVRSSAATGGADRELGGNRTHVLRIKNPLQWPPFATSSIASSRSHPLESNQDLPGFSQARRPATPEWDVHTRRGLAVVRVDLWALATAPTSSSLRLSEGRSGLSRQDSSRAESKARFREIIPVLVRRPGVAPGRSSMTTDGLQPSPGLLPGYRPVRSAGHQGAREEHEREPKSRRATWFARVALRIEVGGTGPTFLEPPRAERRDLRDSRRT